MTIGFFSHLRDIHALESLTFDPLLDVSDIK